MEPNPHDAPTESVSVASSRTADRVGPWLFLVLALASLMAGLVFFVILPVKKALDAESAEKQVYEWLDAMPRLRRDVPPPDNFSEVEAAWVERGKQIPSIESTLIALLTSPDYTYRRRAAYVIGRVGSARSLDALSRVFGTDDTGLQLDAIQSIRAIHDPKCVDVLAVAFESTYRLPIKQDKGTPTQKAIVRANIVTALSEIEGEPAKKLLAKLVAAEKDEYVLEAISRRQGRPQK